MALSAAPTPGPSILLVDDTPANLVALDAVLQPLQVRLVAVRSGREALRCIAEEPFAVVLLDVQMPVMDGFETAANIRALPNGREVPIIFLTAILRDEEYAKRGYASGAADFIAKPFDVDVLRARVKAFVDLFRQREEAHRTRFEARTRELDEAQRRLAAFERISTAALETDHLEPFLHTLLTVFLGAADSADTASVLLRRGDELHACASIGLSEDVETKLKIRVGTGFAGKIASTGRPLFMSEEELQHIDRSPALRRRQVRALYGVPLVHDGDVIGVAHIGSVTARTFSDAEKRLFGAMADRAAWVVSRRRARERLYEVLHSAPALISVWRGPGYECEFANAAYRRQYDAVDGASEHGRQQWITAEMRTLFDRVLKNGETLAVDEHVATERNAAGADEQRFLALSLHPLRNAVGEPEAVLAFAVDLTSQVRARRALEKSERERAHLLELERAARKEAEVASRAKDEFLATASHELRTPLNAILGWTASARRGVVKDIERTLTIIERNARAQARIIDDVLDFARIGSGKLRLDIVPVEISHALSGAVEAVRPAAEAKGVALEARVAADLGIIGADVDRVQQIVWNLLSNAVKFTGGGGRVELLAERTDTMIVLRVSDTGQGIAPDFLPHVFEPFRQADGSTTRHHGGLGLGLAIVKQLVHAHGGTIRAASEGLERGSSFTVELPARAAPLLGAGLAAGDLAAPGVEPSVARLERLRVLVVDDDEDSRSIVREVLAVQGATVELARSAEEALKKVGSFRPHVLVTDIGMPKSDGYALLQDVRALPAELGGRTPAIALTAYARDEDRERATSAGFAMHIAKPVDPLQLVSLVADSGVSRRADARVTTDLRGPPAPREPAYFVASRTRASRSM